MRRNSPDQLNGRDRTAGSTWVRPRPRLPGWASRHAIPADASSDLPINLASEIRKLKLTHCPPCPVWHRRPPGATLAVPASLILAVPK